jgi:ACT domain-containing protein
MVDSVQNEAAKAATIVDKMTQDGHVTMTLVMSHVTTPKDIKEMLRTIEKLMLVRLSSGHKIDMTVNLRQRTAEEEAAEATG